jgi:hypothetical protein
MTIDFKDLERRAVEILRLVAPELRRLPIYICEMQEITATPELPKVCAACTHPLLSHSLRPFVNWTGPGIGIVYSQAAILHAAQHRDSIPWKTGESHAAFVEHLSLAFFLHEAAHALAGNFLGIIESGILDNLTQAEEATDRRRLKRYLTSEPDEADAAHQNGSHSADWLRCCLHLCARWAATPRGRWILADFVAAMHMFGKSDADLYAKALGKECERMKKWPFARIVAAPLPRAFGKLWEADLARLASVRPTELCQAS